MRCENSRACEWVFMHRRLRRMRRARAKWKRGLLTAAHCRVHVHVHVGAQWGAMLREVCGLLLAVHGPGTCGADAGRSNLTKAL